MFKRVLKSLIGILLIPAIIGFSISLYQDLSSFTTSSFSHAQLVFLYGIFFYCGLHLFLFKPNYLYVFGHELIHALATWLCGGKVHSFKVSKAGGSVKTNKSNFFIVLAPYFIPAYVLIFSVIYFFLALFFSPRILCSYFIFTIGASLAFHLIMTSDALKKKQPDIFKSGYIFSFALIFLVNIIVVGMIFCWLFEDIAISDFFRGAFFFSKEIYIRIFGQLFLPS